MKTNSSSAAFEDAAIAWLTERDDGFSPTREREFAQWLRADPRHAATAAKPSPMHCGPCPSVAAR